MFFKGSQEIESQIEPKKDVSLDLAVIKIPFISEVISFKLTTNNVVKTPLKFLNNLKLLRQ